MTGLVPYPTLVEGTSGIVLYRGIVAPGALIDIGANNFLKQPFTGNLLMTGGDPTVTEGSSYTGPLDLVPGATIGISQRALSTSWLGGNLYTIRRDSDNTMQTFAADGTTGQAPVSSITTFLSGANGLFTKWFDQSGNTRDASQADSLLQPTWTANVIGSQPGTTFIGSNGDVMFTAANVPFLSGGYSIFAVVQTNAGTGGSAVCGENDSLYFAFEVNRAAGRTVLNVFNGADRFGFSSNSVTPPNTVCIIDSQFDLVSQALHYNNASVATTINFTTTPMPTGSFQMAIGDDTIDGGNNPFTGVIIELLVYDSVISSADSLAIRQNMAAFYGITLS